jgi:hypothetical protein
LSRSSSSVFSCRSSFARSTARRSVGHVGEGQEDRDVHAGVIEHLAGVQQHRAAAEGGKVVGDLEPVHRRLLGDDRLQQEAQGRDVPLAVAQAVEQPPLGLARIDLEGLVERSARGQHVEARVQDDQRLVDRVHDGLGQRLGALESGNDGGHLAPIWIEDARDPHGSDAVRGPYAKRRGKS